MANFTAHELDVTFGLPTRPAIQDDATASRLERLEQQLGMLTTAISDISQFGLGAHTSTPHRMGLPQPPLMPVSHDARESALTATTPSTSSRAGKPIVKPGQYDGKTSWEDYAVQFDMVANLNGWNDSDKASHLAVSLSGIARSVLGDLPPQDRSNFTALRDALTRRFGTEHRVDLHRANLRQRVQGNDEPLPELAHSLLHLTHCAFPSVPVDVRDVMAKDSFLGALRDADLRWGITQARPRTLQEAVNVACELETHRRLAADAKRRQCDVRAVAAPADPVPCDVTTRLGQLEQLVAAVAKQAEDKRPKCWGCGEAGHFSRECPRRRGKNQAAIETPASGNETQPN